jgi:hypothetical protein
LSKLAPARKSSQIISRQCGVRNIPRIAPRPFARATLQYPRTRAPSEARFLVSGKNLNELAQEKVFESCA